MANSNPEQERTMAEMLRRVSVERGLDALLRL